MATVNDAAPLVKTQPAPAARDRLPRCVSPDDDRACAIDTDDAEAQPALLTNPDASVATLVASAQARIGRVQRLCKTVSALGTYESVPDLLNLVEIIQPLMQEAEALLEAAAAHEGIRPV